MGELLTYAQDTFNADEADTLQWLEDNDFHVHNGTEELFWICYTLSTMILRCLEDLSTASMT